MQTRDQVVVVGASGFGRECLDVLMAMQESRASVDILGVIDDFPSELNLVRLAERSVEYLGTIDEWLSYGPTHARFVLGIGNPFIRRRLVERLENAGLFPFDAIHPSAIVGSRSNFGQGAVVCAGTTISTNVCLGRYVHVNPNVTIGHDSVLDDFVSINPSAVISGEVRIYEDVLVGANSTVLQNLTVGERTVVGAAALVTKHIPRDVVVKGVPGVWNE